MLARKPAKRRFLVVRFVLAGNADEFLQVLQACASVVRILALQLAKVAGLFHHRDEQVGDVKLLRASAQIVDEIREALELLELLRNRRAQELAVEDRLADGEARRAGRLHERRERLLADAAARHVDDPLERKRIRRVDDVAQIRDDVFDLGARVETDAADNAVGDALGEQRFFEDARLRVGAVENDEIAVRRAFAHEIFDLLDDVTRFVALRRGGIDCDRLALVALGEELLGGPRTVVGDESVGRVENPPRAAIVFLELEDARAREVFFEAQDHAVVAAAPRIDRLVVVADDGDVPVSGRRAARPAGTARR